MGLGFDKEDWQRLTDEFSGGWQMRLALAKLLLQKPNLLLLDEPTNHLDLEARNWLEEYLENYPNTFLLISHDRYFLDVTVDKIAEIWNKRFWFYTGNIDKFLAQRRSATSNCRPHTATSATASSNSKSSSTAFAIRPRRRSRVEPDQGTGKDRADRDSAPEEKSIHFSFPQPKALGGIVAVRGRGQAISGTKWGGRERSFPRR